MAKSAPAKVKDRYETIGVSISLPDLWDAGRRGRHYSDTMICEFYKRVNAAGGRHELAAVGLDFAMREWREANHPK